MKKYSVLLWISLMLFSIQSYSQDKALIEAIIGKWKVIQYQSKAGKLAKTDVLVFESDGTFRSDSVYFRARKGLFRTDENRSVIVIEAGDSTTEWITSLKKGVLRMKSAQGAKQSKVYITSVRVKEPDV